MSNLITRKIKYSVSKNNLQIIKDLQRQYSNVLHFTYNRVFENDKLTTKKITELQHTMNNIKLNSHFLNSARVEAKANVKVDEKPRVFGGKVNFIDRTNHKISKVEFKEKVLNPIYSVGEAIKKGNRLFEILSTQQILFKPTKDIHIVLELTKITNACKKELENLKQLQNKKEISLTYKLDKEYVYITYDLNEFKEKLNQIRIRPKKLNRIFAIDQNPNYLGWSVVDWLGENKYKVIDKGVISLKPLNDKWFMMKKASNDDAKLKNNNKRIFEINQIGKELVEKANHYHCEIFAIEKLKFSKEEKSKLTKRQKHFNTLCKNLWCRNRLTAQIKKYCSLYQINFQEVTASYSSIFGNLVYRKLQLPDMILASIEIGRRAYEFSKQYIKKLSKVKKNIVIPDLELVKDEIVNSLEEIGSSSQFGDLKELCSLVRKTKQKYRFSLDEIPRSRIFSKNNKKSMRILYTFI